MTSNAGHGPVEARLRDIQMITDAALSQLADQDFLAELVDRVKAVLRTDTAAVLLLDRSSGNLIATAAAGLEEEVRQGVRIPVGRGFAGRIAAEGRPVILDHVDHSTVLNPILMARGIHALLGVPMVAGGRVIGVMHVGSLTPREFTSDDIDLLQLRGPGGHAGPVADGPGRPGRGDGVAAEPAAIRASGDQGGATGGSVCAGAGRGGRRLV